MKRIPQALASSALVLAVTISVYSGDYSPASPVPVYLGASGKKMLQVAAREAAGRGEAIRRRVHLELDALREAGIVRALAPVTLFELGNCATTLLILRATVLLHPGRSIADAAAVAVFKTWLDRDKLRKIAVKVRTKGEAREVEIEVVGQIRYRPHDAAEQRNWDTVEQRLRPLDLTVTPLPQTLDARLHLAGDVDHGLLVGPCDLDAGQLPPALDRHLEEDVDGFAQHDAATGDDAVQLWILPYRERHTACHEMRDSDPDTALLPQPLEVGERRPHPDVQYGVHARVLGGRPRLGRDPTPAA